MPRWDIRHWSDLSAVDVLFNVPGRTIPRRGKAKTGSRD